MNNPSISIIIPAYNVESYIKKCLDSLLRQTFQDFEVIIVNDGSTDQTSVICNEYAAIHKKISVIHQQNAGVSAARKTGMQVMKGQYFISIDADDWMEPNMLEELFDTATSNDADLTFSDYDRIYNDHTEIINHQLFQVDPVHYLKAQLGGGMWGTYWNKLIRTQIYKTHAIAPIVGVSMWDDYIVTNLCALYANKIAYCPKVLYHYNQTNLSSITKQHSIKNYEDILLVIKELSTAIDNSIYKDILSNEVINMKLFAKNYLIYSQYKDFKQWKQIFPEVNLYALRTQKRYEKVIIKSILDNQFLLTKILLFLQKYDEKIRRNIKKIFCKICPVK